MLSTTPSSLSTRDPSPFSSDTVSSRWSVSTASSTTSTTPSTYSSTSSLPCPSPISPTFQYDDYLTQPNTTTSFPHPYDHAAESWPTELNDLRGEAKVCGFGDAEVEDEREEEEWEFYPKSLLWGAGGSRREVAVFGVRRDWDVIAGEGVRGKRIVWGKVVRRFFRRCRRARW